MRETEISLYPLFCFSVYEGLPPAPSLKKLQSPWGVNYSLKFSLANSYSPYIVCLATITTRYRKIYINHKTSLCINV